VRSIEGFSREENFTTIIITSLTNQQSWTKKEHGTSSASRWVLTQISTSYYYAVKVFHWKTLVRVHISTKWSDLNTKKGREKEEPLCCRGGREM